MVPGGPYVELFARPHNAREGWLSIGNEAIEYHPELVKFNIKRMANKQVQVTQAMDTQTTGD